MGKRDKANIMKRNTQQHNKRHVNAKIKKTRPIPRSHIRRGKKSLLDGGVKVVDMHGAASSNKGFMEQTDAQTYSCDVQDETSDAALIINNDVQFVETCTDDVLTVKLSDNSFEIDDVDSKGAAKKRKLSRSSDIEVRATNNALQKQRNTPKFKSVHHKIKYQNTIHKENHEDLAEVERSRMKLLARSNDEEDNGFQLLNMRESWMRNDDEEMDDFGSAHPKFDENNSDDTRNISQTFGSLENDSAKNLRCVSIPFSKEEACLVIVEHPQELCIQGKAQITMVTGHMTIMGYDISPGETQNIYSPHSCSYLLLRTTNPAEDLIQLRDKVRDLTGDVKRHELDQFGDCQFVTFIVRPLDSSAHSYVSRIAPYNGLFAIRTNASLQYNVSLLSMGLGLFPREYVKRPWITLSKDINNVINVWESTVSKRKASGNDRSPVLITCGGKGGGKSTLNRHLINSTLNISKKVYFLELDVGQTEFTFPGCISLHCVTEPLLGPPFTHIREAKRMCYFGGVSGGVDIQLYIKCVEYVFAAYKGDAPLVINTMGWTSGLGINILIDILHITNPDVVVQINMFRTIDNFPHLTPDFKAETEGWMYNRKQLTVRQSEDEVVSHELHIVETPVQTMKEFSSFMAVDQRNLVLLSYFCSSLTPGDTLLSLTPYTIPWSSVSVHISHYADITQSQALLVLNASIVGLCHSRKLRSRPLDEQYPRLLKEFPMCKCIGFGLVRGVDVIKRLLYIVTPMPLDDLKRVNVLVKGAVNLPEQVIKDQKTQIAKPYIDTMTRSAGSWNMKFHEQKLRRSGGKKAPQ